MKTPAPGRPVLAALALSLAAVPAAAQESGGFVVRLGNDTVAVEQFTRTADRITGTIVSRAPRTSVRTYTAELRPDGTVSRLEMTTRVPAAPELLPQTVTLLTMRFEPAGDSTSALVIEWENTRVHVPVAVAP